MKFETSINAYIFYLYFVICRILILTDITIVGKKCINIVKSEV